MVFFKPGDRVTVSDDPEVPVKWRGISATVAGNTVSDSGGVGLQQIVTVKDQNLEELEIPSSLITPISH